MRRIALIAVILAIAAGTVFWLRAATRREWTTDSPAALAEYERGRQAHMRFYPADARAAFQRALDIVGQRHVQTPRPQLGRQYAQRVEIRVDQQHLTRHQSTNLTPPASPKRWVSKSANSGSAV